MIDVRFKVAAQAGIGKYLEKRWYRASGAYSFLGGNNHRAVWVLTPKKEEVLCNQAYYNKLAGHIS